MNQNQVIVSQYEQPYAEWNQRKLSQSIATNQVFIPSKEFSNHPCTVGDDPHIHCQVMNEFTGDFPGLIRDENGNRQGRNDHDHTWNFQPQCPAGILDEPKQDMQVFNLPVFIWDVVDGVIIHI